MSDILITVNLPFPENRVIKVKMNSNDNIYSLKSQISYVTSFLHYNMVLEHNFTTLYNDYLISECNITEDSCIDLRNIESFIDIFFMDQFGKTHPINVPSDATIYDVKKIIEQREHYLKPNMQRLVFSGKQLEDNKTINDYGIVENSRIHLVLKNSQD